MECEFTALSARCICESWGGSLTSNKSSEKNVAVKSHRQSEVPRKCICHIHEMASGVAAENCHTALRATEALPRAKLAVTLPLSYWPPPFVTCRHLSPLAWPPDVTRVQPRAASTATEGAMWWSGTVKIGVTLTAECSGRCGKLEGQLSVGHQRLDRLCFLQRRFFKGYSKSKCGWWPFFSVNDKRGIWRLFQMLRLFLRRITLSIYIHLKIREN